MTPSNTHPSLRLDIIALAVILASFAVRCWFVASGQLDLVQDEAQYWDWIRRPQLSYYSKGPLVAWVIAAWCEVFGNTELGVRFGAVIGMTGIQAALYVGVSRVWREPRLALFALLILATMPLLNGLGVLMTTDNPLIFWWTVGFFALSAATRNQDDRPTGNWPFVVLAVAVAMGTLAKYMMLAFVGLGFAYALVLQVRGQLPPRFWGRFLLACTAGAAAGLAPIVAWNVQNDWVGFKHVAKLSTGEPKPFRLRIGPFFEMFGAQLGLLGPAWFAFVFAGGWSALRLSVRGPIGNHDSDYRHALQAALFFWPLWAAITFWSLKSKTEANWTAVSFMAAAILGGLALARWWRAPKRRMRGRLLLTGAAAALTLVIFFSPLLPVPEQYNITNRLKGWADLGRKVEQVQLTRFDDADRVFVFSDKYDITAELAFYVPGQPLVYCAWIDDRRMNQYDIWPGPNMDKVGWDAVFVREGRHGEQPPAAVAAMFDSVEPAVHIQSMAGDAPMRHFTLYVCKGYNGHWPQERSGRF